MAIVRTTLPHGNKQKEILKTWRGEYPAKYERIFVQEDLLTRVASDEQDIAWGECIASALAEAVIVLPEKWACIISSEGGLRCVLWDEGSIRRDDIVDPLELTNWLKIYKANDIYSSHDLNIDREEINLDGVQIHVIGELDLDSDNFELQEYLGSPFLRVLKPALAITAVVAVIAWFSWPEPPPPPPPEVADPWYAYKQNWSDIQQAGDAIALLGTTCAKFVTFPVVADVPTGTIAPGSLNMALSEVAIDRNVMNVWAKNNNIEISFTGSQPFLRVGLPITSYWREHKVSFYAMDERVADFFSRLSLIANVKASFEPVQQNGVWATRKATINIQATPWLLKEIGEGMRNMPIKLEGANFSFSNSGSCSLSNAVIEFGGSAQ
ncbi:MULTISPECIES: hypothetical protein [Aeromonas]|uniref:hypothetical protein n=1 Tax=Aeromonas TaxID=642 RepID=UPI001F3FB424|nr:MULTISPECIES: hypothetical protein [Aeromonas]MCF5901247.1 hypothetical protein [Aeromonas veronii]